MSPGPGTLMAAVLLLPVAGAALCAVLPRPVLVLRAVGLGAMVSAFLGGLVVARVALAGPLGAGGDWLRLDALSALHLLLLEGVFLTSSLFASGYFREELARGALDAALLRRFGTLWFAAHAAMALVLLSNNLGIQWVALEATTLLTAFLVCLHTSEASLEAMWKYLLLCSVGVAFAFMGMLLFAAAGRGGAMEPTEALLWTHLVERGSRLDQGLVRAAFLFLLVGYGTKAGLAPMHSWLPDAHSQAPGPVSALFSGFLLNTALYGIVRLLPVVSAATGGPEWAASLLRLFGLVSIGLAAAFILFQRDLKRLLAYSSVEHVGIMALGFGLGPVGAFAALWHALGHSLAKPLAFFSAGRLGQHYGSHQTDRIEGALEGAPVWGCGLLGAMLALLGAAPFSIFGSELLLARAAAGERHLLVLAAFLAGVGIVFVGALRPVVAMVWGAAPGDRERLGPRPGEAMLVGAMLAGLVLLGLWLPAPLRALMEQAVAIVGGRA